MTEKDPLGLSQHAPGAKLDAGKVRAALVLDGFSRALWAVSEVGTFGANKYTDNGWMSVGNGLSRYADAAARHKLKRAAGEENDPDSNLKHLAHEAWNVLAQLELLLRKEQDGKDNNAQGVQSKSPRDIFQEETQRTEGPFESGLVLRD